MKKHLMKLQRLIALLLLATCGFALPAHARWVIDRYEVTDGSTQEFHTKPYPSSQEKVTYPSDDGEGGSVSTPPSPKTFTFPAYSGYGEATNVSASAELQYAGRNTTLKPGSAHLKLTVTPIFKWLDDGGGENLSAEFFYRELCRSWTGRTHSSADGPYASSEYNELNRYDGRFLTVEVKKPSDWTDRPLSYSHPEHYLYHSPDYSSLASQDGEWIVSKTKPSGTEARGETRTFTGEVKSDGVTLGSEYYGSPAGVYGSISVSYKVEVVRFSLDVFAGGEFARSLDKPRDKGLDAYAGKNWMGRNNIGAPIKFFWGSGAGYAANISSDLLEVLNNPEYKWDAKGASDWSTDGQFTWSEEMVNGDGTQSIPDEQQIDKSTPTKSVYHQASDQRDWEGPTTTTTSVTITGKNAQQSKLTAKAKINWYRDPTTRYRSESKFEMIDLDSGEVTPFSPGAPGAGADDEEAQLNAYIAEINATKEETFETGQSLVSLALEGEMMVGSWFVPDETDILVPVAGHVAGKLYSAVKKARVLQSVLEKINKIGGSALAAAKKARLAEGKSDNIIIRVTNDVEKEGHLGHLPDGSNRAEDAVEDAAPAKKTCFFGEFCFAAGTQVLMADGSLKAIELVKAGDLVLSKDEATGEVAAKPVTKTFVRQAPATLALTFSNGETIETTAEHPFFVQDKGFTPAGLVALGNSIVTRAGPSLAVTKVEKKDKSQTVYNFSVAGFHTYFVGSSGLWTHNTQCGIICYGPSAGGNLASGFAPQHGGITLTSLPKPPEITNFFEWSRQVMEYYISGGGKIYFDLSNMDDVAGVLAGTAHTNAVTSQEIRYIRDNWNRFSESVTFFKNSEVVGAPW